MLADLLDCDVVRPQMTDLTSVGIAKAALRGAGHEVEAHLGRNRRVARRFHPREGHRNAEVRYGIGRARGDESPMSAPSYLQLRALAGETVPLSAEPERVLGCPTVLNSVNLERKCSHGH